MEEDKDFISSFYTIDLLSYISLKQKRVFFFQITFFIGLPCLYLYSGYIYTLHTLAKSTLELDSEYNDKWSLSMSGVVQLLCYKKMQFVQVIHN